MRSDGILVIASQQSHALPEMLSRLGLAPLVQSTLADAIEAARQQRLAAVAVDAAHPEIDPVQCVLQLREIDAQIAILVVGAGNVSDEDTRLLLRLPHVCVVDESTNHESISQELDRILQIDEQAT
jgi:DNA-binding response OmpR family regulator